ncbi:hypothetical protein LLH00_17285 [bacterium]|nr:hypothetical protein [bacterium]
MLKFFRTLILAALLPVLFISCKDNSNSQMPTASTDMLGQQTEATDGLVLVRIKDGDGPWQETWMTPVMWDGVSELKSGVVYSYSSKEQLDKAMNKSREDFLNKTKGQPVTVLACDPNHTGYADIDFVGSRIWGFAGASTNSCWTGTLRHALMIQGDCGYRSYQHDWTDCDPHSSSISYSCLCPSDMVVDANVWLDGESKVDEHNENSCN